MLKSSKKHVVLEDSTDTAAGEPDLGKIPCVYIPRHRINQNISLTQVLRKPLQICQVLRLNSAFSSSVEATCIDVPTGFAAFALSFTRAQWAEPWLMVAH